MTEAGGKFDKANGRHHSTRLTMKTEEQTDVHLINTHTYFRKGV